MRVEREVGNNEKKIKVEIVTSMKAIKLERNKKKGKRIIAVVVVCNLEIKRSSNCNKFGTCENKPESFQPLKASQIHFDQV